MSGLGLVNAEQLVGALNGMGNNNPFNQGQMEMFQKALTVSSGYTGYNLEREVKFRLPAYTVLRNRVAVDPAPVGPMAGTAAVYKAQLGYNGFNFGAAMGTGFGQNGPEGNPNATQIAANYKSQSIKGSVQLEAIDMARMFTDPIKDQSMFNLQTLMRVEELLVTGGNEFAIDAPAPVGSQGTSGTGFANGTWTVKVTAITLEGALRNATSPYVPVLGVAAGESVPGTVSIVVSGGEKGFLNVSWPVVEGAVGYKVYCSDQYNDSSDVYLLDPATELAYSDGDAIVPSQAGQVYIGVNNVRIIAPPAGSTPAPSSDGSANDNQFEGYVA